MDYTVGQRLVAVCDPEYYEGPEWDPNWVDRGGSEWLRFPGEVVEVDSNSFDFRPDGGGEEWTWTVYDSEVKARVIHFEPYVAPLDVGEARAIMDEERARAAERA